MCRHQVFSCRWSLPSTGSIQLVRQRAFPAGSLSRKQRNKRRRRRKKRRFSQLMSNRITFLSIESCHTGGRPFFTRRQLRDCRQGEIKVVFFLLFTHSSIPPLTERLFSTPLSSRCYRILPQIDILIGKRSRKGKSIGIPTAWARNRTAAVRRVTPFFFSLCYSHRHLHRWHVWVLFEELVSALLSHWNLWHLLFFFIIELFANGRGNGLPISTTMFARNSSSICFFFSSSSSPPVPSLSIHPIDPSLSLSP